ncbi:Snf7-domain-containing protein [Schizopora paradoxa]|uniref:Snf7-domain-containing protein n=1 Tax=Schizopora paradoxa TaxID=27342 RepID=A0A0H2RBY6_9AGAM|nr:Snf7-domain-containing protein [Schizopora paradoxa]
MPNERLAKLFTYSTASTTRLKALYSDISLQKHSNPTSFNANVEWWKRTLTDVVANGLQASSPDVLSLTVSQSLQEDLRYEGAGKPLGLASVVSELRDTHALIPFEHFLSSTTPIYHSGSLAYRVATTVVGKPLWWALQQLSFVDGDSHESEAALWRRVSGRYVVLSLVEKAADAVERRRQKQVMVSRADALYSFETFREAFGDVLPDVALSNSDLKVLVKYLDRDRRVLVSDGEVIKFTDVESDRTISVVDRGILEVKTGIANTEAGNDELQRRIDERDRSVRECIRQGRKEAAVTHLRSKKGLEESLRKRLQMLGTLQDTLRNIEQAADNLEMMKHYESSTSTLKAILSHPSLQRDKVDETLEGLAAVTADHREIDEAIQLGSEMAQAEAGIDDADLEAELAGLVADAEKEEVLKEGRRVEEIESSLPNVPSRTPAEAQENAVHSRPELVPLPSSSTDVQRSKRTIAHAS